MPKDLNGWLVEAMTEVIDGVQRTPEAGRLACKSRVTWDGGFGLDVRPESIEQLRAAMPRHFTLRGDHPPELLGQNTGPTAIETLLAALGACMAGTFAAQATARGIELDRHEVEVEGRIDLSGFFGLRPVAPGISDIRLTFHAEAADGHERLLEVLDAAQAHSPVFDTVTKPRSVELRLA